MIWELKRPELETLLLPPDHLKELYTSLCDVTEKDDAMETTNQEEESLSPLRQQLKQHCIQQITDCIDPQRDGDDAKSKLNAWLQNFDCKSIVKLFSQLNEALVSRNGMVVETNEKLQVLSCCSVNSILLGSFEQSVAAMFYVAPYVCKNKATLETCLIALEAAQTHVTKHESTADDAGTSKRFVQHMFTRVLNTLSRTIEVSDTQVALYLLNMGTEVTSDSYSYFGGEHCTNYFCHQTGRGAKEETEESKLNFGHAAFYRVPVDSDDISILSSGSNDYEEGTQYISVPVHYPAHWWYRGRHLRALTQFEYYALIDVKPLSSIEVYDEVDDEESVLSETPRYCKHIER